MMLRAESCPAELQRAFDSQVAHIQPVGSCPGLQNLFAKVCVGLACSAKICTPYRALQITGPS